MGAIDLFYAYGIVHISISLYFIISKIVRDYFDFFEPFYGNENQVSSKGLILNFDSVSAILNITWVIFGFFTMHKIFFIIIMICYFLSGLLMGMQKDKKEQARIFYLSTIIVIVTDIIIMFNHFVK